MPPRKRRTPPAGKKPLEKAEQDKTVALNRKAFHDYDILDTMEAGISLRGSEIKSIRAGAVNLREAFARVESGEIWLYNAHIARYDASGPFGHEPTRPRKLLLHRKQINSWASRMQEKGLTIIPLKLYLKRGLAKLELGLARGRKIYDKREKIREREIERELRRK